MQNKSSCFYCPSAISLPVSIYCGQNLLLTNKKQSTRCLSCITVDCNRTAINKMTQSAPYVHPAHKHAVSKQAPGFASLHFCKFALTVLASRKKYICNTLYFTQFSLFHFICNYCLSQEIKSEKIMLKACF